MRYPWLSRSRAKLAIVGVMIVGFVASFESGAPVFARQASLHPAPSRPLTCSGKCWSFENVDDNTSSASCNQLTGINSYEEVVGAYQPCSGGAYQSFAATPHPKMVGTPTGLPVYPSPFPSLSHSGSGGDYNIFFQGFDEGSGSLSGITFVGSWQPGGTLCPSNICGVSYKYPNSGSWTSISDPHQGSGGCAVTEVLGINDSLEGVGYYEENSSGLDACKLQAFEYYTPSTGGSPVYVDIFPSPLPAGQTLISSEATGINQLGDIVGTVVYESGSTTATEGWLYADLNYYFVKCPAECSSLYATDVNFSDNVAGYYTATGSNTGTYGFWAEDPKYSAGGTVVSVSDGSSTNTRINAINDYCMIAGSSEDSHGVVHGIVGYSSTLCKSSANSAGRGHIKLPAKPRKS
jgi:hypothetical protein